MEWKLFEELTQLHGVSGYERNVATWLKEKVTPWADEIRVDPLGDVIAFKKGTSPNAKKLLFCAHMDEIGVQVMKVNSDGTLTVKELGFWFPQVAVHARVQFRNGTVGVLATKGGFDKLSKEDFYVDIGVSSKEEAEKLVDVGDVANFMGSWEELAGNFIMAKAIDDRVGCYMQLQALLDTPAPRNDIYMAFTVMEEVGTRGGQVCGQSVHPDVGIAVDVTPASDRPGDAPGNNTPGNGTAIKISDTHSISSEDMVELAVSLCKEKEIKFQKDVIARGGTDAGAIALTNEGVKNIGFSVVTRYTHGQNCMVHKEDVEATVELIKAFMDAEF